MDSYFQSFLPSGYLVLSQLKSGVETVYTREDLEKFGKDILKDPLAKIASLEAEVAKLKEQVMTIKLDPKLSTPRDWQAIALKEASELLGTPEGKEKLIESKRYGILADIIDEQSRELLQLRTHLDAANAEFRKQRVAIKVVSDRAVLAQAEADYLFNK